MVDEGKRRRAIDKSSSDDRNAELRPDSQSTTRIYSCPVRTAMMATTHALAGMALVSLTGLVAPEYLPAAVCAAAVGGIFPDLDLFGTHRLTLHYPVLYSFGTVPLVALAVLAPSAGTVVLAAVVTSAALHSVMDAFGGGLELKPWQGTSDRAVYSHYHRRWVRPRRWIRYDGAPEDVLLAAVLAAPLLVIFTGRIQTAVAALLGLSLAYGFVRKPLVAAAGWLVDTLPADVVERLPGQFTEDLSC
ncbi:MAG: hypothetical protein ACI8TL_002076 [Natronomonas sp.]